MKIIKSVCKILLLFYTLLCAGMFFYQDQLLFYPEQIDIENCFKAKDLGIVYKQFQVKKYKVRYLKKDNKSNKNLIVFHGNAATVCNRLDFVKNISNANVFLFEYPGYGGDETSVSQKAIYQSAEMFMTDQQIRYPTNELYVYGESLGTGVATYIALKYKQVKKLFLQSPFTSISDVASKHYPYLPIHYLLKNSFEQEENAQNIKAEVYIFYGLKDRVIPYEISLKQFKNFNTRKVKFEYPERGHGLRYGNEKFWNDFKSKI